MLDYVIREEILRLDNRSTRGEEIYSEGETLVVAGSDSMASAFTAM